MIMTKRSMECGLKNENEENSETRWRISRNIKSIRYGEANNVV